jgi:uncharacterized protein YbjT (DUF2867 family)
MKIKAIINGATGMVGEGVLLECLNHPDVEQVLVINRKPGEVSHPELHEIIHTDFFNLAPIESQLIGYNACFFCLGVSSVGTSKEEYKRVTYDLTLNVAQLLAKSNPEMTFCYVTGAGTDSSEQGRIAWARVKGATENALMRLFKQSYMFRPAFMKASPGQKNVKRVIGHTMLTDAHTRLAMAALRIGQDRIDCFLLPSLLEERRHSFPILRPILRRATASW